MVRGEFGGSDEDGELTVDDRDTISETSNCAIVSWSCTAFVGLDNVK
jgi:hypothetical protein